MLKSNHKNNPYIYWGVTVFLTVIALLAVYDICFGAHKIIVFLGVLLRAATPVIYGAVIAYLLAPVVDLIERTIFCKWFIQDIPHKKQKTWVRVCSVFLTILLILGLITLLLWFMIPDVANNLRQLMDNIPHYTAAAQGWLQNLETITLPPEIANTITTDMYTQAFTAFYDISTQGLPRMIPTVSGGVVGTVGFFGNLIVGLVVAAYILGMKETLSAQGKKIICAILERSHAQKVLAAFRYTDTVFGGFIRGNILDAIIIGVITFIVLNLLGIPYTPLISVLIGVTNLIPFFGPFLGAIPSCLITLLVDPVLCLELVIFVLVLQQFDGNILKPRIFGQSMGIASLWVIISIIIGGALFGTLGMLLGCPVFALLYTAFRLFVERGLERRNMPIPTDLYRDADIPPSNQKSILS